MRVLIDTCLPDLFISIVKDNKTVAFSHKKNLVKKADELSSEFEKLLKENNLKINDIKEFYITTGPGSFMGCRTALIFVKTICMITKAKLFYGTSFIFTSKNIDGTYFIDAKGEQFYKAQVENKIANISMANEGIISEINYEEIIAKPSEYLGCFEECEDIIALEALYIKDPRIGGE